MLDLVTILTALFCIFCNLIKREQRKAEEKVGMCE